MKDTSSPNAKHSRRRDLMDFFLLISPVLFLISIGTIFHGFVIYAVEANISINVGIIVAAAFGVYLIVTRMRDAQSDFRVIERFGAEAAQGVYMKNLLNEPWLKGRYVRHYLSHIANTGGTLSSHMEQSAIENELHALQGDYNSRLELPQFLVGFMIAMGLLGTFIGLLETLTGISGMLDGMAGGGDVQKEFMKLVVELRKPLAGMGIAFSASMFGLISSLMLSIMMTLLRRYISRVVSLARNVMHDLIQTVRTGNGGEGATTGSGGGSGISFSPDDIAAMLENETLGQSISGGASGGGLDSALAGRFDVLVKKIELLVEGVTANTENTKRLNELLGFGPRMQELTEKTVEAIRDMSFDQAANHKALVSELIADQEAHHKTVDSLNKLSSEQDANYKTILRELLADRDANGKLTKDMLAIGVDIRDAGVSNGRHLNEIKENFTRICQTASMVELIATSVSTQGALLDSLLGEMRRSHQTLTAINRNIVEK